MNIGYGFSLLISFLFPLSVFAYVLFVGKEYRRAFVWGVLSFTLSQLLLRMPLLQLYLGNQPWFILFSMKFSWAYVLFLSLSAALFEETARLIIFKMRLNTLSKKEVLLFGLGHGGIEAFVLVGLATLAVDMNAASSLNFFYSGLERVSAMILHVALSYFVYKTISKENKWGYIAALIIHTLFNMIAVILMMMGTPIYLLEGILFISALLMLYSALREKSIV